MRDDPRLRLIPAELRGRDSGAASHSDSTVLSLIDRIAAVVRTVPTVEAAGHMVLDVALHACPSSAACVLMPDAPVWRVGAERGLRPLERRLELSAEHWMITTSLAAETPASINIEESDIARARLAGAPLSSRRHLLVSPLASVQALVVMARDDGPYGARDVSQVSRAVTPLVPMIDTALQVRDLARALEGHLDYPD